MDSDNKCFVYLGIALGLALLSVGALSVGGPVPMLVMIAAAYGCIYRAIWIGTTHRSGW